MRFFFTEMIPIKSFIAVSTENLHQNPQAVLEFNWPEFCFYQLISLRSDSNRREGVPRVGWCLQCSPYVICSHIKSEAKYLLVMGEKL